MDYNTLVALPPVNDSEEEQDEKLNQFIQIYPTEVNGKVKKPRKNDWSGLSPAEK